MGKTRAIADGGGEAVVDEAQDLGEDGGNN